MIKWVVALPVIQNCGWILIKFGNGFVIGGFNKIIANFNKIELATIVRWP